MKPSRRLVTLTILGGLLPCLTSAPVEGGQSKRGTSHRGGQAAPHMSSKGAENTNAQWSADPEKGWVRAGGRRKADDKRDVPGKSMKNSGKHKSAKDRASKETMN